MMFSHFAIASAICFVSLVHLGNSYRILGVFPFPSISHQVVFRALTVALNKRGHELVVATTDPINDPTLKNYTEIDLNSLYSAFKSFEYIENRGKISMLEFLEQNFDLFSGLLDSCFNNSELQKLYAPDSNEKFDLLIAETLLSPGVFVLATRFNVPIISISTLGLSIQNHYVNGNPTMPSHPATWEIGANTSGDLSFWSRLKNFIAVWKYVYAYHTKFIARQTAIAKKYFGNDIPDILELERNISVTFVNQQGPISYARPRIPKVIETGGFHVKKQMSALSKDLKKMLDESTEGFVYMSLGTNVKSKMLSDKIIDEFVRAFSRLPYKVLWKFDNDILPGKPDNVHIMKWVPQQAVLAHPNLKVFIYQGGLQSTEEAVANAVPLIGFPIFGDQDTHVAKMVSLGVALKLEINTVDADELYEAIRTVATDSSYKSRMLNLRSLTEDKPQDPLETAVWWTEFVLRHKGAPHLHSSTADEPWYSRQDMDIVAFISAGFVIVLQLTLLILYRLIKKIYDCNERSLDTAKKIN